MASYYRSLILTVFERRLDYRINWRWIEPTTWKITKVSILDVKIGSWCVVFDYSLL